MDNLTHSLVGLTLARTPIGRDRPGATAVLLLASNAPDIDAVAAVAGRLSYLEWHRGPTHGPGGVVGLGLLAAGLVWMLHRADARRAPAAFLPLSVLGIIGVACHVLMDLPTVYGTRLLSPFSWTWWAVDWMPIIDVYLLVILAAALWIGRRSPTLRARAAAGALVFMLTDYGARAWAHHVAMQRARVVFANTPARPACAGADDVHLAEHWPREDRASNTGEPECPLELAAMPDFLSIFEWRVIARYADAYRVTSVNLARGAVVPELVRARSMRYPNIWTTPVRQAATSPVGQIFLGFSRFPAVTAAEHVSGTTAVRWTDLRFVPAFFDALVEVRPDGTILGGRLGR